MNDKPRQVLRKLLADDGMSLAGDRGRCSALLRDMCSNYKAETNLLIAAMDEGIPAALVKDCNSVPAHLLIERLTKHLQDDRHLTRDAALWAVESWVFALRIATENREPDPPSGEPASMEELYKAFIGPNNRDYYLRYFERFDSESGKVSSSWNWSAFFFSAFWFLYRKMWRNAFIYYFLMPLLVFLTSIVAIEFVGGHNLLVLVPYIFYGWKIMISVPMYANAQYYQHCQKQIDRIGNLSNIPQIQLQKLSARGGTGGLEIFLLGVLLYFGVGLVSIIISGK